MTFNFYQYVCEKVTVQPLIISNVYYYQLLGDNYILAQVNWPQTYGTECPYTVQMQVIRSEDNLSYTTNIIKIDISAPTQFNIVSNSLTMIGTFVVTINLFVDSVEYLNTGTSANNRLVQTTSFTVFSVLECQINQVTGIAQVAPISLKVGTSEQIQIPDWLNQFSFCNNIQYQVISILPEFITFDTSSRIIKIQPIVNTHVGIHMIQIKGQDTISSRFDVIDYSIEVLPSDKQNIMNYLNIKDINVYEEEIYTLPIFKSTKLALEFFQSYQFDANKTLQLKYITLENFKLILAPQKNDQGSYKLGFTVLDILKYGVTEIEFKITVLPYQNKTNLGSKNNTDEQGISKEDQAQNKKQSYPISARIISITIKGEITIRFNQTINLDLNRYNISQLICFQIRDGYTDFVDYAKQRVVSFYAIQLHGVDLTLQLQFLRPETISQNLVRLKLYQILIGK
ncbi:UNKNOWN [Stylonychia lemnae]|uniref:Uncharacterized protein n=1 Tax=Stylonychia lemnae TaxID=5949 RepID=A0A077ZVG4_STYLE|nr:UNKNOWN [Stylonychia lemnae]|eukprot:CDW72416.1 UNKNOWN [Stylonychia lemnae]